jgi:hypothetical protein
LDTSNLFIARRVGNCATDERLAGCGQREPVRLVDAGTVSIGLCVRRTQVDLSRRDVGMPKFLPQGFNVNAVLMPPSGIQHTKGVARFLRFLDRVIRIVRLVDETVDDAIRSTDRSEKEELGSRWSPYCRLNAASFPVMRTPLRFASRTAFGIACV